MRSSRYCLPSFILSLNGPAAEDTGEVFGAALEWSGSFESAFEVDPANRLRALVGVNPLGEAYHLAAGVTFKTPAVLWTHSATGQGQVSPQFPPLGAPLRHPRRRQAPPGAAEQLGGHRHEFRTKTSSSPSSSAQAIGADTFLLDDGWFGNAHPRNHDNAGLGDWQVNTNKLPHGLAHLADETKKRGLNFGIWIEPEMVNPASDLYEQHPDWAMQQPHRPPDLSRNQPTWT